ncbi:hypothetical protein GGR54DRAFT_311874 [Hypoxylon sp. NC1633]|nr:hypothetical protein GGR54DRAFT_311874 [Hypoxylon sp. NC1633]
MMKYVLILSSLHEVPSKTPRLAYACILTTLFMAIAFARVTPTTLLGGRLHKYLTQAQMRYLGAQGGVLDTPYIQFTE